MDRADTLGGIFFIRFSMHFFQNLSLRARLMVLGALVVLALSLVGGVSAFSLLHLNQQLDDFRDREFAQQGQLVQLRQHLGNIHRYEKDVLLSIDEVDASKAYQGQWRQAVAGARETLGSLRASAAPGVQVKQVEEILALLQTYEGRAGEVIQRTINGQIVTSSEANQLMGPAKDTMHKADPLVEALAQGLQQAATQRVEQVGDRADTLLALILGVSGLALAVFVPATWGAMLSITRPINRAVALADEIAAGNLSQSIHVSGRGEIAALMRALASMQASLREVVASVKTAGDAILSASGEVAHGSLDLSTRTERAAAELQRTASGMQELSAIVQASRQESLEVSRLGSQTLSSARQGDQIVHEVVSNMGEIEGGSRQIAQAVVLIDKVAFQTNLLALNAAVEAARAGEQGKGFAVVAAEVRQLARTSAEAAREITQIIRNSTQQVTQGSSLVQAARTEMQDVLSSVDQVAEKMSGMSARIADQSHEISRIADAIQELDAWTQENAALVEQSSAAAESLRQQALTLSAVIERFRLTA